MASFTLQFELSFTEAELANALSQGWPGASPALASASAADKLAVFRDAVKRDALLTLLGLDKDKFLLHLATKLAPAANAALVAQEERLKREDLPAYVALMERTLAAQAAKHALELEQATALAASGGGGGGGRPRLSPLRASVGGGGSPAAAAASGGGGSAAAAAASPCPAKNKGGRTMEGLMPPKIEAASREEQMEWCYSMWAGTAEKAWKPTYLLGGAERRLPKDMEEGSDEHKAWCLDTAYPWSVKRRLRKAEESRLKHERGKGKKAAAAQSFAEFEEELDATALAYLSKKKAKDAAAAAAAAAKAKEEDNEKEDEEEDEEDEEDEEEDEEDEEEDEEEQARLAEPTEKELADIRAANAARRSNANNLPRAAAAAAAPAIAAMAAADAEDAVEGLTAGVSGMSLRNKKAASPAAAAATAPRAFVPARPAPKPATTTPKPATTTPKAASAAPAAALPAPTHFPQLATHSPKLTSPTGSLRKEGFEEMLVNGYECRVKLATGDVLLCPDLKVVGQIVDGHFVPKKGAVFPSEEAAPAAAAAAPATAGEFSLRSSKV